MKIRSEYEVLAGCVERGIDIGHALAHKREVVSEDALKTTAFDSVMKEISKYFSFDNDWAEEKNT